MIKASNAYKEAMRKSIRERAYISVTIGIVNGNAQSTAQFDGNYAWWSNKILPFRNDATYAEYATFESDYMRCDGQMLFLPRNTDEIYQLKNAPLTTENVMESIIVTFPKEYSIKGLTLDFGKYFPTRFKVISDEKELIYSNSNEEFLTTDVIGNTKRIEIIPISMVGGNKRFRIQKITMGVGLTYDNSNIVSANFEEFVHGISAETPYQKFNITIFDEKNVYNVDDENSFINFLETGQKVEISYGMTLPNNSVEWIKKATLFLDEWNSKKNQMSFSATDIFETMTDDYTGGYQIYDRTAYEEAIKILNDFGLESDEYIVDDCLRDIELHNPMPKATHKQCLQLLCNACRCSLYQDENGRIIIKANFANVIEPKDIEVEATKEAWWSNAENVLYGSNNVYSDLTRNFMRADGLQLFLPRIKGSAIEKTGYVTESIADTVGNFEENPVLTLKLPAAYTYYGVYIKFQGNPPQEIKVHTYNNEKLLKTFSYTNLKEVSLLNDEFSNFNIIKFEICKAYPKNRVLIDSISFGNLSDYTLSKNSMVENPYGYSDKKVKDIYVKIFEFEEKDGEPKKVENNVYFVKNIGNTGDIKYCENQLISNEEHAKIVAEWIGNYYSNRISYDVSYRGDPVLCAPDIIYMESDVTKNLQVEVEKHTLNFNGAFSGSLNMRKALGN